MPAKIGVEQGVAASANKAPTIKGYKKRLCPSDFGIFFTITGRVKSKAPTRFKPITRRRDAIIKIQ